MKLKIPNILTIGRIIIVPIFVLTFFLPGFFGDLIPFFLFVLLPLKDIDENVVIPNQGSIKHIIEGIAPENINRIK
jgi:CDP-diacylglycerol--glycerol-3-phosphate 3-phosphatidyltransferase/cardiolipin synthase